MKLPGKFNKTGYLTGIVLILCLLTACGAENTAVPTSGPVSGRADFRYGRARADFPADADLYRAAHTVTRAAHSPADGCSLADTRPGGRRRLARPFRGP